MSPPESLFAWSSKSETAAQLVAEDRLSDEEIAAACGIARRTLTRWKTNLEFAARVDTHIEAFRRESERFAIAQRGRRVAALHNRWRRLQRVIEERAASEEMHGIPGGETGLLVHQVKGIGRGDDFQVVHEYVLDDGLLGELRAHEQQVARELGQWTERHDVTVLERVARQVQGMDDAELLALVEAGGEDPAAAGADGGEAPGADLGGAAS